MRFLKSDKPRIEVGAGTHTGVVREENQDSMGRFEAMRAGIPWTLLVICDGMGGHNGGSRASKIAVDTIGATFMKDAGSSDPLQMVLHRGIKAANEGIFTAAQSNPELTGMGTTCVALAISLDQAYLAHVGDSRIYRVRPGVIEALTTDHSNVQRLIDADMISAVDAKDHPESTTLYRCVGVKPDVSPTILGPISVTPGDRFLLCSDGLHGYIEENLVGAFTLMEEPQIATQKLIELANRRGGRDNVSVQIAYRTGGNPPSHKFRPDQITVRPANASPGPASDKKSSKGKNKALSSKAITLTLGIIAGIGLSVLALFLLSKSDTVKMEFKLPQIRNAAPETTTTPLLSSPLGPTQPESSPHVPPTASPQASDEPKVKNTVPPDNSKPGPKASPAAQTRQRPPATGATP